VLREKKQSAPASASRAIRSHGSSAERNYPSGRTRRYFAKTSGRQRRLNQIHVDPNEAKEMERDVLEAYLVRDDLKPAI